MLVSKRAPFMYIIVSIWEGEIALCCFSFGSIRLPWKHLLIPLTKIWCVSHGSDVSFLFCFPRPHLELCPALGPQHRKEVDLPLFYFWELLLTTLKR